MSNSGQNVFDPQHQQKLEELIAIAKEQGFLTYEEINEVLPMNFDTPDLIDQVLIFLSGMDIQILNHRDPGHGPRSPRNHGEDASILIDATLKENFPPIALPKREYMERAKAIWEELGLPELKPEAPWHGYSLGEWSDDLDAAAARLEAYQESFARDGTRLTLPSEGASR